MKNTIITTFLIATFMLSACSPIIETRGNLISDTKFEQVTTDISTRADVVQKWGPPTVQSSFDQNTWYYIGETTHQKGIMPAEVKKRRMILVKFDKEDNDTVIEVADLDVEKAQEIALVERKTATAGKQFTILQQFVGNLGKFNRDAPK